MLRSQYGVLLLLVSLSACTPEATVFPPPTIGFYHWQQRLEPDSLPLHLLAGQEVPELVVRCFDIDLVNGQPEAISVVEIAADSLPFQVVPIVFVTNRVMRQTSLPEREKLADNLLALLSKILGDYGSQSSKADDVLNADFPYQELQIDCDWTANTRINYFSFLSRLKSKLPPYVTLTTTIRLHQFRDRQAQGIPPTDRGVLMAYNVGNLNSWETDNSIIDTNLTAAYLLPKTKLPPYPVPLDLALPSYEWGTVYRRDKLAYLLEGGTATLLIQNSNYTKLGPNRYRVEKPHYLDGYYLNQDDLIRFETISDTVLTTVSRQFQEAQPGFVGQRWLFYRIGSSLTRKKIPLFHN